MSPPLTSTGEPHLLPTQLLSTSNCHWRSSFGRPSNPIQNLVTLYMVPLLPGSLPILIPSRFVVVQQRLVYFYPVAGPVLVSLTWSKWCDITGLRRDLCGWEGSSSSCNEYTNQIFILIASKRFNMYTRCHLQCNMTRYKTRYFYSMIKLKGKFPP